MAHILVSEVGERTVILRSGIVGNTPKKKSKNEKISSFIVLLYISLINLIIIQMAHMTALYLDLHGKEGLSNLY